MDKAAKKIVEIFIKNVIGRKPDTSSSNKRHDGKEGHWLETQMGIVHNRKNKPDIFGYEMKDSTSTKTTFGDWSADYYIFKNNKLKLKRDDFMKIFGKKNLKKKGRYSWSGEPIPKINTYNNFGQILKVDNNENIFIEYSYFKDKRKDKNRIVPEKFRTGNCILAKWNKTTLKKRVESKFNVKGWFICEKNKDGYYNRIVFGPPITWDVWISDVRKGLIFFDSGMYSGNKRPYSQWRAFNNYWFTKLYSD